MNKSTAEKIFIGFMAVFAIDCLVLGKVYNENTFYVLSLMSIVLITICIVNKGMVFDIFKNPRVSKRSKISLIIFNVCYPLVIIMNIAKSNWMNTFMYMSLAVSINLMFMGTVKKEIEGKINR